jgi:predicted AAA+ superfamily ATPase
MRRNELIVYRNFADSALFERMSAVMEYDVDRDDGDEYAGLLYKCIAMLLDEAGQNGFYGNLWHCYLTNILVNCENSYSEECERRGTIEGTINDAVLHDIEIFKEYFDFDFTEIVQELNVPELEYVLNYRSASEESRIYNTRIRDRICRLAEQFDKAGSPQEMKDMLTQFYKEYGVGRFGLHKAFRIAHDKEGVYIEPIKNILHVYMKDLIGYERAKKKLIDNTEAFLDGRPCNNVLLYGEAGTGKSSSIKALANEYYERGLRIIEVYRYQFQDLNDVIAQIKNRNYRFILYMDDLSFEEFETEYKYLKAVIEGGLEKKPENVLIYATSNRRHLIRENFADRDGAEIGDKHSGDTVQEKLSLSDRFGVSIYYGAPDYSEYVEIVFELAKKAGITMDQKELKRQATEWEMKHGGLSGRTAQQFIDYVTGTELAGQ